MFRTILLVVIFLYTGVHAQEQYNTVFQSGLEGHKNYRIPAIVSLPKGKLLAFAEGRVDGLGDYGDVNIVLKTSVDNGRTWSAIKTVVDYDNLQAGNPAPVVDLQDPRYPQGRVFLFYNTGNNHEPEVRKGRGLREVWYVTSTDGGQNWSKPVNITLQVHKPNQPNINPNYNFAEDWRAYANTPGHAIQFQQGKYKGRIYVAANHSEGPAKKQAEDYFAHGFYTDDHGDTFKLSNTIPVPGGNESTAAELADGRLVFNARNQTGKVKARIVVYSNDGGHTWGKAFDDANLPDPACQASILVVGTKKGKNILAFSNLSTTMKRRDNLTLKISYDEGASWAKTKVIDKDELDGKRDNAGYSDIVKLNKSNVGILYEKDGYSKIVFKVVNWKK